MGDILNIKQIPFTVKIYAYTCIDHEFPFRFNYLYQIQLKLYSKLNVQSFSSEHSLPIQIIPIA